MPKLERTHDKVVISAREMDQIVRQFVDTHYPGRTIHGKLKFQITPSSTNEDCTAVCWLDFEEGK